MTKTLYTLTLLLALILTAAAQEPTPTPNVVLADKLGINNPNPIAPIHLRPSYPEGVTAAENVFLFTNPNGHSFGFNLSQTLQGNNQNNDVFMMGWNVDLNHPDEPTLRFSMERAFGSVFELHLESWTPFGGGQRPWTWDIQRDTGEAVVYTSAVSHFYGRGWLQNGVELHIGKMETLSVGPFRQQGDSFAFETLSNGGQQHKQIRVLPHPSDTQLSMMMFGRVKVSGLGDKLDVSHRVNAVGYEVNGSKVVGSQCPAIPDSTGGADDARAVNALLNCLRSHGLIAP